MKKLTIIDLGKRIEAENAKFETLSKAEKRVVIAQDCLIRIDLEQIEVKSNKFCSIPVEYHKTDINIKNVLNTTTTQVCKACAKGSLFMSYIGRVNKLTFVDIENENSIRDTTNMIKEVIKINLKID